MNNKYIIITQNLSNLNALVRTKNIEVKTKCSCMPPTGKHLKRNSKVDPKAKNITRRQRSENEAPTYNSKR